MVAGIFAALAEYEHSLINERAEAAREAARPCPPSATAGWATHTVPDRAARYCSREWRQGPAGHGADHPDGGHGAVAHFLRLFCRRGPGTACPHGD
jgi:hypothetical protein